jgi:glutathionylspermidine synthase
MKRLAITPQPGWEQKIKDLGFVYYKDYYNAQASYEFTAAEIDRLEAATAEIFDMCLAVVAHVIKNKLWDEFFIPKQFADLIQWSWEADAMSFYGRMDLAYDGREIKLLEFNADTPTALLEASVVQWYWLQEHNGSLDQFNSIHEKLVEHLKVCKPLFYPGKLYFTCLGNSGDEDFITVKYLEDAAHQAGIDTEFIYLENIALNDEDQFVTANGTPIRNIFKLYPYEWMFAEDFGAYLNTTRGNCYWIEPAYKAILSNKMLLHYLYELFPDSPYIMPCKWGRPITASFVKKPVFSREGANITIVKNGTMLEYSDGEYGAEGYVFQEYFELPDFDGYKPVIGSWLIGGKPAGIGIREGRNLITDNMSLFCPHYFK